MCEASRVTFPGHMAKRLTVVIIHHSTVIGSIDQYTLPTRTIHISVAFKHLCATTRRAGLAASIGVRARDGGAATHPDGVLLPRRWLGGLVSTANAGAEEEIVVRRTVVDERPFHGVAACGVVGDLAS